MLLVCGSARNDGTCPGEISKTWRLTGIAQQVVQRAGVEADLQVSTELRLEQRIRQVSEPYGSYYGHDRYGDRYGMWGSAPRVHSYREEVIVVRIDLFDGRDGQPVWSSSAETLAGGSQGERAAADFIVLEASPLEQIRHVRRNRAVVIAGSTNETISQVCRCLGPGSWPGSFSEGNDTNTIGASDSPAARPTKRVWVGNWASTDASSTAALPPWPASDHDAVRTVATTA